MLLIHTALACEARPFIERFAMHRDAAFVKGKLFRGPGIELIVSGAGAERTAAALSAYLLCCRPEPLLAVNAGICGSSDASIPLGRCFSIRSILDLETKNALDLPLHSCVSLPAAELTSVPRPWTVSDKKLNGLVDMEAAAFANTLSGRGGETRLLSLKTVSDYLGGERLSKEQITAWIRPLVDSVLEIV